MNLEARRPPFLALRARCEVKLDMTRRRLQIRAYGLWDSATTLSFLEQMTAVQQEYALSGAPPRALLTIIDLREHGVQAQDTVGRLAPEVHRYYDLSNRTAILVSRSALATMQAKRYLTLDRHRFFTSEIPAQDWLTSGLDATDPAGHVTVTTETGASAEVTLPLLDRWIATT